MQERDTKIMTSADKLLFYAFCCMFFFLPVATSPAVIASLFAVLIWIASGRFIKDAKIYLKQDWLVPTAVLALLPWIGLFYTENLKTGLEFAGETHYWLLAPIASSVIIYRNSISVFLKLFIAGLSVTSIISLFQYAGLLPLKKEACIGLFSNYINLSLLLVFGILVMSFYFKKAKEPKYKILTASITLLFFLSLRVVPGRTGYLSFILLSPFLISNIFGTKHIARISITAALLGIVLFASPVVQERIAKAKEDIKEYKAGNLNTSLGQRFYMWQAALKIFLENPIFGAGTGAYMTEMAKQKTDKNLPEVFRHPHNSFLYMAVNHGIIGLSALLWMFAFLLKKAWKFRNSLLGFSICSATLILTIGSLTDTQIIQVQWGMLLAVFTGFSGGLDNANGTA
ncbi:MAG: O-antigen ligase family protein [Elusimicrobia bacterium]|nr:O-antigen ligase family protein [Elusimicrobiota bacterium]